MALTIPRIYKTAVKFIEKTNVRYIFRGGRPEEAKTIAQRLAETQWKDPELYFRVNIGYTLPKSDRKELVSKRISHRQQMRNEIDLEKAARQRTLAVPLNEVEQEWEETLGPYHIRNAAEHYGVYDHLFGDAYFIPVLPVSIKYDMEKGDSVSPVYYGNIIKPNEANSKPFVTYNGAKDKFYTLVMTTPDCHFTEENSEYLHWLVGNIPGNDISKGEELCDHMRPFPPRGTGYCRYVFVLYEHKKKVDLSKHRRENPCNNLAARTFSTYNFYRDLQDDLTPVGLSFFQSDWDSSVTDFYHHVLEMKEPVFEYDFEPPKLEEQDWFPTAKPFDKYLDR